jgi:hypothetical protein
MALPRYTIACIIVTCYDKTMMAVSPRKRGRPPTGKAMSAAERMRRMRDRRKAAGLKPQTTWISQESPLAPYSDHGRLDLRSLAMHTVIARKLARDPRLLAVGQENLKRWSQRRGGDMPAWLKEWEAILEQPWREVAALITELSPRATRLRQSSPFAGVLTAQERKRIYDAFRA